MLLAVEVEFFLADPHAHAAPALISAAVPPVAAVPLFSNDR